jgi:hypothetical protein
VTERSTHFGKEFARGRRWARAFGGFALRATALWLWGKLLPVIVPAVLMDAGCSVIHLSWWFRPPA